MKAEELRDLNVIGAFALALADDFKGAMQDLADGNESACAALVVIGQESGLSVDRLSKILELSQPGTVRLVDRPAPDRGGQAAGEIAPGRPPACSAPGAAWARQLGALHSDRHRRQGPEGSGTQRGRMRPPLPAVRRECLP
jgi:hypothetical protein